MNREVKVTSASAMAIRIASIATQGPTGSNSWPMSQGKTIPPQLAPTKNQLVTFPVMCSRLSARESMVGKIEAMPKPTPKVPIQIIASDFGRSIIRATLTSTPITSTNRTEVYLNFAVIGIDNNPSDVSAITLPETVQQVIPMPSAATMRALVALVAL